MRIRCENACKRQISAKTGSKAGRVFASVALAAGMAFLPAKNAIAQEMISDQEVQLLSLLDKDKKTDTMHVCFDGIDDSTAGEKYMCPKTMALIVKKDVENAESNMEHFSKLAASPNFSVELLELLKPLIEKSDGGDGLYSILTATKLIIENPNYSSEVMKTMQLISKNSDKESYKSLLAVSAILKSESYSDELLETVNDVIKKYKEKSGGPLQMLRYMLDTSSPKVDFKSEDFTEKVSAVSDVFFSKYVDNSYGVFAIFGMLARQKSFSDDLFTAAYAEEVSDKLKDVAIKGDVVMRAMLLPLMHKNSDTSILEYEIKIVNATGANSERALVLMFLALSNENLMPKVCDDNFVEKFSYIINYIASKNPGHEKEVLLAFQKVLSSPNFKFSMLENIHASMLNTISQKISKDSQNSFDYESLLKNWNEKPEMPNKEFEEQYDKLVEFINDETGDRSTDTINAMNEIVRHKNFKPYMFEIIRSVIENSTYTSGIIITLDGPETVPEYTTTSAPEYLLDFHSILVNHGYNSKKTFQKIADASLYIIEDQGQLGILDAVLANQDFKLEMVDEYNMEEAKKFIDYINEKNGLDIDSDDFEIVFNFSYALSVIGDGDEKKEIIEKLHTEMGITYFARYGHKALEKTIRYLDKGYVPEAPIAFAFYNQNDHNQAFYWDAEEMDNLAKYYELFIFEAEDEDTFYDKTDEVAENFGKIKILVLSGHGTTESVNFGKDDGKNENEDDKEDIDIADAEDLKNIKENFEDDPIVVIVACSSGAGEDSIAAVISESLEAEVWAPNEDTCLQEFVVNKKGFKKLNFCGDATNKFVNGEMVMKNNKPYEKETKPKLGFDIEIEPINFAK